MKKLIFFLAVIFTAFLISCGGNSGVNPKSDFGSYPGHKPTVDLLAEYEPLQENVVKVLNYQTLFEKRIHSSVVRITAIEFNDATGELTLHFRGNGTQKFEGNPYVEVIKHKDVAKKLKEGLRINDLVRLTYDWERPYPNPEPRFEGDSIKGAALKSWLYSIERVYAP